LESKRKFIGLAESHFIERFARDSAPPEE